MLPPEKHLKIGALKWNLEAILHAKSILFVNINGNFVLCYQLIEFYI